MKKMRCKHKNATKLNTKTVFNFPEWWWCQGCGATRMKLANVGDRWKKFQRWKRPTGEMS